MISLNQISLQRGGNFLLEDASMALNAGQRAAIVGVNGCGKTSLFKLILGELQAESGDLNIVNGVTIAHMKQEIGHAERSARDYVLDGHEVLRAVEAQLSEAEKQGDNQQIAECHAKLDAMGGYTVAYEAETILQGLGFTADEYDKDVASFSGGWRIRLNLARALLCPSQVLLLDEPTNHLDMEAIHWLEEWLRRYEGSVLLISHDRDFIDAVVSVIHHIENKTIHTYTGSYSSFEEQRAQKLALQQSLYEKQQQRRQELQKFIDRFKAKATKAKQAQSRVKALEKMQLVSAVREASPYQFTIPNAEKFSSPLVNWFKVDCGYENVTILNECTFSVLPGMRLGLLGENGAGKSTLIKTLAGLLQERAGEVTGSEHLKIGYFAQHQLEALDLDGSPILHIQRISPETREQEIRDFLGSFMIIGDMATSEIRNFSGGEKARLALAIIAWQKPNLLLLDEPTNHLDMQMREALTDALQAFQGAVILVSHDRYLLRHCVDEFMLVDQGKLDIFKGELEDYYAYHKEQQLKKQQSKRAEKQESSNKDSKKQARQDAAKLRQQLAPLKNKVKKLERELDDLNEKLAEVRNQLSDPSIYDDTQKERLQSLIQDEAELKQSVEEKEEDWFTQQELLAEAEA